MRISNTKDKDKRKAKSIKSKIKVFKFLVFSFGFAFYVLSFTLGCNQGNSLDKARQYALDSEKSYQIAVKEYKNLIAKGNNLEKWNFELGNLYYLHGRYDEAVEQFKKTNYPRAKKLLGIVLYRQSNFAQALEVFKNEQNPDDESLYYYGLSCEKLNLFDQALKAYAKIKDNGFKVKADERIHVISRETKPLNIKEIDPAIGNIIESAPGQEAYPQAGALVLLCEEESKVSSDGTQLTQAHYLIKILNDRGKEDFSETQINYDSTFERVELEYARTILPDATVADVGSRHIRDVSRYLNFPLYSNARVRIISFPEVCEGAVIEYKFKIYNNELINKKDFVLPYPLQIKEPLLRASFLLTVPSENSLNIKTINDKFNDFGAVIAPKKELLQKTTTYRWEFENIPQIMPEPNMPPDSEINPTILISSFKNWREIYDWWWGLAKDKISADTQIKKKTAELIKNKNNDLDKARAIYNYCAQDIRYVAVEYGQAGYEPHKAEDIFKNKYGDCKDQAILLVTMLREAGLTAWPVLIATKDNYNLDKEFPAVLFNHCIAAVSLKEGVVFLDPTAQTCSFGDLPSGDQARQVLVFKENGFEIMPTPLYPAGHNLVRQQLNIKINKDESILAKKSIFTFGIYDQAQRYWLLYTQPELIQETLGQKIQEVSIGASLEKYNIENLHDLNKPVVLSYDFHGPEYATLAGPLFILPQLASVDVGIVAKEKRKYSIDFEILESKENTLEIEVPENTRIKYLPENISVDTAWLKFSAEYKFSSNKLILHQASFLKKTIIPESEYLEFKKFYETLAKKLKQRVVLEKVK
ncbi:MAG: DUF3857 domain-containing protein [Candidatus Omnitrophica bacterium]|nr:DUF3857 domain-containing protein [Candidatus Omnitrophota bacterium]